CPGSSCDHGSGDGYGMRPWWPAPCGATTKWPWSLTSLSGLAADVLACVLDALALVRLRLAQLADVGRDLADGLLVDPLHRQLRRGLHREGDALGSVDGDRVRVAEVELELGR